MRTFIALVLAVFAVGFVSCSDSSTPTDSQPLEKVVQEWQDFEATILNTCCGQEMTISGRLHFTSKGGRNHINAGGITATDADGNTYHGNLVQNTSQEFEEDGSGCVVQIANYNFSGSGDCDFSAKVRIRACVDADGNVTYTQEVVEINCF